MMLRILTIFLCFVFSNSNAQIVINEFSAHKGVFDENNNETDWIEIFNNSNQAENLSSYFLTDDLNELEKWQLPEIYLMPNEMILFYSSGKNTQFNDGENTYFHTNFKLSNSENIALYDGNEIIDSTFIDSNLYFGISLGKYPDGNQNWCYFNDISPNGSNSQSVCYQGISLEPIIDLESGWYTEPQNISCINTDFNTEIHFTTDGSVPTTNDPIFNESLNINSNTCVSARAFSLGLLPSKVVDKTFIFEENNHNLAVFSIHTNPSNLWDYTNGIYVSGPNASNDYPYFGSNFWEAWSKYSRLEYFDRDKNKVAEEIFDLEIHGGWSRAEPQKSFRLDFKSKYSGRLEHALIPSKNHIESYNNINLRNGGQHTWSDKIQDALISKIASETKVNYMAYEPCIVYLNGEYWGVYGIREKIDEHYIEDNYGVNSDSIDLMNAFGVLAGSDENANETFNLIMDEDVNSENFYSLFSSNFNIDNYIDYFVIQTFIQNMDWMGIAWGANNIKLWRPQTQEGKWNYVLYDTDGALGYFGQNYWENYLAFAMSPQYPSQHSQLFNKVLQNNQFKCEFTNRYADLLNTSLKSENFFHKANLIKNDMILAMPDHIERWQNSGNQNGTISSIQAWESQINSVIDYYNNRIDPARYFLDYTLDLQGMTDLSLDVSPINSGKINLNTIVVDSLPWNGVYFNACDLSMNAIPENGYSFSHWTNFDGDTITNDINLYINVNNNQEIIAHFIKCEDIFQANIYSDSTTIYTNINSSIDQFTFQWYLNGIPFSNDSIITQAKNGNYQLELISNYCNTISNQLSFQSNVGINTNEKEKPILVYPNPFNSETVIEFSNKNREKIQINIIDISGRVLVEIKNVDTQKVTIKRGNLKAGIYYLEIIASHSIRQATLIIQ